jgi:hypothetical protein
MKFEDLPEPKHRKIGFFRFLKETWYFYIIPYAMALSIIIWNDDIMYWIFWIASWITLKGN